MPSKMQVLQEFIEPMESLWRPPYGNDNIDRAKAIYVESLENESIPALKSALEYLKRNYKKRDWPTIADINSALKATGAEKPAPRKGAWERLQEDRYRQLDRYFYDWLKSPLGKRAIAENWDEPARQRIMQHGYQQLIANEQIHVTFPNYWIAEKRKAGAKELEIRAWQKENLSPKEAVK